MGKERGVAMCRAGGDRELEEELAAEVANIIPPEADEELKKSLGRQMALLALVEKTGYNLLQENGQRMYGGPPPEWEGPPPPQGCEVFVGKLPRDMYEDELVPLFETAGKIYALRLMMEFSGVNRGYAFIKYTNRDAALRAIQTLNNFEVRPGKYIGVCMSTDNCRLFIGGIPKDKSKEEILEAISDATEGVVDVIVNPCRTNRGRNRGYTFVEYESHKAAALARRKLMPENFQLLGHTVRVNWAEPERHLDHDIMQRIRTLHVRNLLPSTSEDTLRWEFSRFKPGCVERVRKLTDYAFVHYFLREDAVAAMTLLNGTQIEGTTVDVSLAKPPRPRDARRPGGRVHLRNGGGDGSDAFSQLSHLGNPVYSSAASAGGDADRRYFPLFPGTPLSPTSLLLLKPSQINSAVSLLEFFCSKNYWPPPEYQLFSTPGPDGSPLLLYKVMILQVTYIPDKLCVSLDEAKELAAQTALWNLGSAPQRGSPAPDGSHPTPDPLDMFLLNQ